MNCAKREKKGKKRERERERERERGGGRRKKEETFAERKTLRSLRAIGKIRVKFPPLPHRRRTRPQRETRSLLHARCSARTRGLQFSPLGIVASPPPRPSRISKIRPSLASQRARPPVPQTRNSRIPFAWIYSPMRHSRASLIPIINTMRRVSSIADVPFARERARSRGSAGRGRSDGSERP
jgi:hypothetical protein